jgi:predicted transcriptional regulator
MHKPYTPVPDHLAIRLAPETREALDRRAREIGCRPSQLARRAIERYCEKDEHTGNRIAPGREF